MLIDIRFLTRVTYSSCGGDRQPAGHAVQGDCSNKHGNSSRPSTNSKQRVHNPQTLDPEMNLEPDPVIPKNLDPELLDILGFNPSANTMYGTDIQQDLAIRLEHIAAISNWSTFAKCRNKSNNNR